MGYPMSPSIATSPQQDFNAMPPQDAATEERIFFRGASSWVFLLGPVVRAAAWITIGLVVLWLERLIRSRINSFTEGDKPGWLDSADKSVAEHSGGVTVSDALGYIGTIIFVVLLMIAVVGLARRIWEWFSTRYTLTNERIEIERGIIAKHIENVELWRVRDINFVRKWWHALLGVAWIQVAWVESNKEQDREDHVREIGPIHGARSVYEQLKHARLRAGRSAGAQAVGVT
jgi:hypothetical protein